MTVTIIDLLDEGATREHTCALGKVALPTLPCLQPGAFPVANRSPNINEKNMASQILGASTPVSRRNIGRPNALRSDFGRSQRQTIMSPAGSLQQRFSLRSIADVEPMDL